MSRSSLCILLCGGFLAMGCSSFSSTGTQPSDDPLTLPEALTKISNLEEALDKERSRGKRIQAENLRLVEWQKEQKGKYLELAQTLQEGAGSQVAIRPESHQLTITVLDHILFDSGDTSLKSSGIRVLNDIGPILDQVKDQEIRIEGHTDHLPLSAGLQKRYPSNWELSTARATEVIRFLIEHHQIDPRNLMALGYADTRPIASNATEEGRQQNRRIEIVLSPKDRGPLLVQQAPSAE